MDVAYLDFLKAFDSVPHQKLVRMLQNYGVRGNIICWINKFLSDRQHIWLNGVFSEWAPVTSAQWYSTGLSFWSLTVCHLCQWLAQRSGVWYDAITDNGGTETFRGDLVRLHKWSSHWLLPFNVSRCSILHLVLRQAEPTAFMQNVWPGPCESFSGKGSWCLHGWTEVP